MSPIAKLAEDKAIYRRTISPFPSGRSAFKAILQDLDWEEGRILLLPAYIGWSSREGSGVFDPVRESGIPFKFYKITANLNVDVEDLQLRMKEHPGAVVLVIHYFGRVDPNYNSIINLVREGNGELIEDQAHAMLTDIVGGVSGRAAGHAFFSFHKLLPVSGGGARIFNGPAPTDAPALLPELQTWDLHGIAQARRKNFTILHELLAPHRSIIEPLWPHLADGEVPQTYPVRLISPENSRILRDRVYERMNNLGFGVVSLYHTMISELKPDNYPDSFSLANSILNLPVHQDLKPESLAPMASALVSHSGTLGSHLV